MPTKGDTCTQAELKQQAIEWDRDWKRTVKRRNTMSLLPAYKENKRTI